MGLIKLLPHIQFIKSNEEDEFKRNVVFFKELCEKSRIDYQKDEKFLYSLDIFTRTIPHNYNYITIGNLTVNYSKILNKGLKGLKKDIKNKMNSESLKNNEKFFLEQLLEILQSMTILRDRQLEYLMKLYKKEPDNKYVENLIEIFSQVPLNPARTFPEALQSILFINSLIWMDKHSLVGLGRLDQILSPFLERDLYNGTIEIKEAKDLVKEFLKSINKYYEYKSNVLLGDTGQVIVLSGKNKDETDASNPLTLIFLSAMKELKLPDPKIVLRVHSNTPDEVWEMAFQCLREGLGYPLFSNDEIIINSLINFGYNKEDSFDYATSACWEPLIPGKSLDQNNLVCLNFLEPLTNVLNEIDKNKIDLNNFNNFLDLYKDFLKNHVYETVKQSNVFRFEPSPLLSILIDDCIDKCRDISDGGAQYNHFGLLSVAMGNTINALLNIKKIVFEDEKINLSNLYPILMDNFRSNKALQLELTNKGYKYGMDDGSVINLTNELINTVQITLKDFKNIYGAKYKFGLSSTVYISDSVNYPASFDGRMFSEPFGVHISPINTSNVSYTAISNFASALSYEQAFNGGVVDIMVEKNFLRNNKDDFLNYLKISFQKGVMQMQINVLNPETLIKARDNPELYPNLIVRVWGFSAYFKDLPDEYKDLIIKRTLQYESQNHQYTTV